MGNALKDKGELDAAIDSYKQAIKIKPDLAHAYFNLGAAWRAKGILETAVENFEKAIAIKPDYVEARHLLAASAGETTKTAPREYVENLFDSYASKFDQSLYGNAQLQYSEGTCQNHQDKSVHRPHWFGS